MRKTFLFTFFSIITSLAFLSPPLLAGNFAKPTATPTTAVATPTEIPHYPISTTVPVPAMVLTIPYTLNVTVDLNELKQVQFIDTNTIAYRQWGNLYIHHLITQTTKLIVNGNDVTSFDWSLVRQQFAVIKNGRLLLINAAGNLVEDLSEILASPDNGFEVRSCQDYDKFIKADSNRIESAEWDFDEDSVQFVYPVNDTGHYCNFYLWQLNVNTFMLTSVSNSNDPVWEWLNAQTLVSSGYYGGGNRKFSVIDVPNNRTIFSVDAWGTYPSGSPNGSRLAVEAHDLRKLLIFDTATGQQIFEQDFGNEDPTEDAIISVINWSRSGRYVVLHVTKGIRNNTGKTEILTIIVDIDTKEFWPLPAHSKRQPLSIIWLPDRDQALMFDRQHNTTYMSRLLPEVRQVIPIGTITDTISAPYVWPDDSRFLPMTDQKIYNPADPTPYWNDTNAGIWFWDRQKGGLPYPIYLVAPIVQKNNNDYRGDAAVSILTLSPDETWLVFGQQVGWSVSDNPYYTDITLQAIRLPSGKHHQITKWSPPDNR